MKKFDFIEQILFGDNYKKLYNGKQNFNIQINGGGLSLGNRNGFLAHESLVFELVDSKQEGNICEKVFLSKGDATLKVTVCYEFFDSANAIRQTVSVKNEGNDSVTLTHISSAIIEGFGSDGSKKWYDDSRFVIHECDTVWQGECQLREKTFRQLGLVPTTTHNNHKTVDYQSVGSWTTHKYYPMTVLEDKETNRSFFLEVEPAGSWKITYFNACEGFAKDGVAAVEATCADTNLDAWEIELKKGEEFTAQPCVYGMADGGFGEAVACLTEYKRVTAKARFKGRVPSIYNTYMNGIWTRPTTETLLPLIDACADAGIEIFCIDAGWFSTSNNIMENGIGDYVIAESRFEGYGLRGIFDYMKSKNIIPGIWLESESCQEGEAYHMSDNCLCLRNGKPLGGKRAFFNFREECVREHMEGIIDMLYNMGVRYIKNDYNQSTGIGFSNYGESFSKESQDNVKAFLAFMDKIKAKYPDMIIENCASGGMREDNFTLNHFELSSTSDQELYQRYPSIASGSLACLPPEKAGIWAFPYPVLCYEQDLAESQEFWQEKHKLFADGEETVFNIVTAMLGVMYFSGRFDMCDAKNFDLIKEGIAKHKELNKVILEGNPIWPCGSFHIDDKGVFTTGLHHSKSGKTVLAVWNIDAECKETKIDISKWVRPNSKVRVSYPQNDTAADLQYDSETKKITIRLPDIKYSARLIEID